MKVKFGVKGKNMGKDGEKLEEIASGQSNWPAKASMRAREIDEVGVSNHVFRNMYDALRLANNILESDKRDTAADRQINYAWRLVQWVQEGKRGTIPGWIPKQEE